jgi:hypothetical protein
MTKPVHTLLHALESERLREIEALASWDVRSALATEALERLAYIQLAITAVREELAAHEPKLGGGSEPALD